MNALRVRILAVLCSDAVSGTARVLPVPFDPPLLSFREVNVFRMYEAATFHPQCGRVSSATILIVDDEPEVRAVVAEFLEDFGYPVLQAEGGRQALRQLQENPSVRLLITDIRMPEMSGIELADLATERNPRLKVILISGYFIAQQVRRRFLRKPFRMKELEAAVRAELAPGEN